MRAFSLAVTALSISLVAGSAFADDVCVTFPNGGYQCSPRGGVQTQSQSVDTVQRTDGSSCVETHIRVNSQGQTAPHECPNPPTYGQRMVQAGVAIGGLVLLDRFLGGRNYGGDRYNGYYNGSGGAVQPLPDNGVRRGY